jgi:hypothetical protein
MGTRPTPATGDHPPAEEHVMPLVNVKLAEGVYTESTPTIGEDLATQGGIGDWLDETFSTARAWADMETGSCCLDRQ